jgi:peptide/nickel transport system permease protein
VLRSQTLILRNSEFVAAARVTGEPSWRIILFEVLPNMISLTVSSWIGAVIFVIVTEATLAFLGLCVAAVWWIFKTGYRLKS